MQIEKAWKVSKGDGVTVAVIDSGVDASKPELRGQVLPGVDVTEAPTGAHVDTDGHGTQMAALIAGTGAEGGVQGVAPGAKILPIKDLKGNRDIGFELALHKALKAAVASDAKIISISQGATHLGLEEDGVQKLVDEANKKGKLVFASSGNDREEGNEGKYPAKLPGVVAVGAANKTGTTSKFSAYGPHVALAAPGEAIPGRCIGASGWCQGNGTSQATAITSASAALIWAAHPDWTNNQVLRVMMETAGKPEGKVPSRYIGYGTIRPARVLLQGEGNPGPADVNPLPAAQERLASKPSTPPAASASTPADDKPAAAAGEQSRDRKGSRDTENSGGVAKIAWIGAGIGAAAALALAVYALFRRKRA
ncbi:S8 family serine peptidase [Streptomyces sp. URMC 123]|uniref:S8 family serine peptidase n=1 Tax=Streptomyces sp. URMC 123 TaxID=3423403 RepID=UPI003F1A9B5D